MHQIDIEKMSPSDIKEWIDTLNYKEIIKELEKLFGSKYYINFDQDKTEDGLIKKLFDRDEKVPLFDVIHHHKAKEVVE